MINRLHKQVFAIFFGLILSSKALAVSYDLDVKYGFYSFSSQTSTDTASISFPGYFGFEFDISVTDSIVIAPGYSLYIISTENIDFGYGFDLIGKYFPTNSSTRERTKTMRDLRPTLATYVMLDSNKDSFNQYNQTTQEYL